MSADEALPGLRVQVASTRRCVPVPQELVDLYAPRVGPLALAAWVVLRLAGERGQPIEDDAPAAFVARSLGVEVLAAAEALRALELYALVESAGPHGLVVHEPLSAEAFQRRFGPLPEAPAPPRAAVGGGPSRSEAALARAEAAAAGEGAGVPEEGAEPEGLPRDVRGVLEWYHQRIGLISESQFERLCEWITRRGMTADVVALAIEETARSAQYASFSYLEGVLRNWYNQGVRTWQDLSRRRHLSAVLAQALATRTAPAPAGQGAAAGAPEERPMEGVPNAGAYRPVDPEQVRRWKEMYARGR